MKEKIIFIIAVLLILSILHSCGSSKKSFDYGQVSKVEVLSGSSDISSIGHHFQMVDSELLQEDIEVTHIVYDTSCDTSKIASKTTYKKHKRNDKRKEERSDSTAVLVSDNAVSEHRIDSIQGMVCKEYTETTVPKQMSKLVYSICILFALIIVWYIMKRYARK